MAKVDLNKKQWRILSIDGGGIYGYTAALWLREMCERDPDFLAGDSVDVFTGCSSGAVNSLLLASEENPRDAILEGKLEDFWQQPGTFTNSDPVRNLLSYYGLTGWYGERDFLDLLESAFGQKTLGDLPHKVFISCFDWHGLGHGPTFGRSAVNPFTFPRGDTGSPDRCWEPYFFNNFVPEWTDNDDRGTRVVDVGYAAATPPGFRAMRGGVGDGASFNANPSADALSALLVYARSHAPDKHPDDVCAAVLPRTTLLSLGDGSRQPHSWWAAGDFGFMSFSALPTNLRSGALFPPTFYSALQPASENSDHIVRGFLGDRYYRLNPGVMALPTLMAAFVAKWRPCRDWILNHIRAGVRHEDSVKAVEGALEFITAGPWK
ncbi:MAG: patatin-like phospholipase family protein [Gemmatimonadota bacterium]